MPREKKKDVQDLLMHCPTAAQWARVGIRKHHGINVPLFALRSVHSSGIGEYLDLIPLIDWCAEVGLDVIQLLPLNDTGPETSPFSALSAIALDPKYLSLNSLPNVRDYPNLPVLMESLRALNGAQLIQYEKIHDLKQLFLRQYFAAEAAAIMETSDYQKFVSEQDWLEGYCLYKTMRNRYLGENWDRWPSEVRDPKPALVKELSERYQREINYHRVVQYLCYQQMKRVREYAESKGVLLKGDIPILINRESADVWLCRELFDLKLTAGAPPDMYAEEGQKWGFPLYNWVAHEKEQFHWWKNRLRYVANFYHLYRLDHIVGFFRIFAIPFDKTPSEGYFLPNQKEACNAQGKAILEMMVRESPLLPIGEDLGVIPPYVRATMHQLGICGTKVPRWERNWKGDESFIPATTFDPLSMTTLSTHDSQGFRMWWEEYPEEAELYSESRNWEHSPVWSPELQSRALMDAHRSSSLFHIDLLQELLALFPELVWTSGEEERINTPGTIDRRNWRYRFRPPIEEIAHHKGLKEKIKELVAG